MDKNLTEQHSIEGGISSASVNPDILQIAEENEEVSAGYIIVEDMKKIYKIISQELNAQKCKE